MVLLTERVQNFFWLQTITPLTGTGHAITLRQTDRTAVLGQKAVLKIDVCFTDDIVRSQKIIILDTNFEIFLDRQGGFQLEHAEKDTDTLELMQRFKSIVLLLQ